MRERRDEMFENRERSRWEYSIALGLCVLGATITLVSVWLWLLALNLAGFESEAGSAWQIGTVYFAAMGIGVLVAAAGVWLLMRIRRDRASRPPT